MRRAIFSMRVVESEADYAKKFAIGQLKTVIIPDMRIALCGYEGEYRNA